MPDRRDVFAPGHYYHIYNRGAGRGALFFGADNYTYCLRLVKRYAPSYGVGVIAYCLMPNHYHFLLRQDGNQSLSRFINVLFNAYVQAVNRQQGRQGTLFEGRFRHAWVDSDEYLAQLCRYIHLNPVYARLVARPEDWPYSNYQDWVGLRQGTLKDEAFVRELCASLYSPASFPTNGAMAQSAVTWQRFVAEGLDEVRQRTALGPYVWD